MIDIISHNHTGKIDPAITCLDHGFVRLVDCMPRISYDPEATTCDHAIVQAARVSYASGTKKVNEDRGLIRYLLRHRHTTPLEMIEFKFHCSMPLFVARQWIRHRTASVNEMSGRYSIMPDKFYFPDADNVRQQSLKNKQVSEGSTTEGDATWFLEQLHDFSDKAYSTYEDAIEAGIGREQARMILPLNLYTEWYWKIDCWNMLHFLSLRCDAHAQQEIRVFGEAMLNLVTPLIPWTIEAWNDYHPLRDAMLLTRLEVESLRDEIHNLKMKSPDLVVEPNIKSDNKREIQEWVEKSKKIGF